LSARRGSVARVSACMYFLVLTSLLRRGLHEVSSEGKVSAQGVMGSAQFYSRNFM
jgi:hypothetical protein